MYYGLSREINIFFCELFLLCPCLFRRFFENILYLVIADTNLHILFNLLNLTFENILNCQRIFSAKNKISSTRETLIGLGFMHLNLSLLSSHERLEQHRGQFTGLNHITLPNLIPEICFTVTMFPIKTLCRQKMT